MIADARHQLGNVDVVTINTIDHDHSREMLVGRQLETAAGIHFQSRVGIQNDDGGFDGSQRAADLADEVGVAGAVDQVDAMVGVLVAADVRKQRLLLFLLVIVGVEQACAVID